MYIFFIVLITLIALVMTVSILMQAGKGGGLSGIGGGGGQTTQVLGARQAPDFLEKATWTLGTAFIVLCVLANFFASPTERQRSVIEGAQVPLEAPLPGNAPALGDGPGTIQDSPMPPNPSPAPLED